MELQLLNGSEHFITSDAINIYPPRGIFPPSSSSMRLSTQNLPAIASMGSKAPKTVVPAVQLTKKGRLPSALSFSTRFSNSSGIIRPLWQVDWKEENNETCVLMWVGVVVFIQRDWGQRLDFNPHRIFLSPQRQTPPGRCTVFCSVTFFLNAVKMNKVNR